MIDQLHLLHSLITICLLPSQLRPLLFDVSTQLVPELCVVVVALVVDLSRPLNILVAALWKLHPLIDLLSNTCGFLSELIQYTFCISDPCEAF